jgi:hypothetical protein
VGQQSDNHKVLKISLDVSVPVDAEVYQILSGFSSALERKNYLQSAVLYYARSPLVITSNALVDRLGEFGADGFSMVCQKLDEVLEAVRAIPFAPVEAPSGGESSSGSVAGPGGLLGEEAKLTLLSLKQKFKV